MSCSRKNGRRTFPEAFWNPSAHHFQNKTRLYVSPWLNRRSGEFVTARTFRAPEQYVHLYQHFLANGLVVDVPFFNEFLLRHTPRDIQRMIAADEDIWKTLVPEEAHRSALHFR